MKRYDFYKTRLIDPGTKVYVYNNYFDVMVASDCIKNPNGDWKYDDWYQFGSILEIMTETEDWFLQKHYKIEYIHGPDLDTCFEIFEQMKRRYQYSHTRLNLIYAVDKKYHKEFIDSLSDSDKLTLYYGDASYID